jgi:hypothetical protein
MKKDFNEIIQDLLEEAQNKINPETEPLYTREQDRGEGLVMKKYIKKIPAPAAEHFNKMMEVYENGGTDFEEYTH